MPGCCMTVNVIYSGYESHLSQSKTLRKLANAPWYISNITLHNDLRIPYVTEVKRTYAKNHKNRTAQNNNQLITRPVQSTKNRTAENNNQLIRDLFNQPKIGLHKTTTN
jgi:hypothetical protein